MSDSPEKLARLVGALNLIPYLSKHPHATPMEIARDVGREHTEVMEDLKRLRMSGVGKGPGEMIDLTADWTGVTVIDDQGLTTPLRLTPTEANALLLTLESLETMPGLVNSAAVTSAASKLREVVRGAGVPDAEHYGDAGPAETVARATQQRRMLEITYHSATSDQVRTRTIAPLRLFHRDGRTYLSALEGEEAKTFRLDRVIDATLIDAPVTAPTTSPYDAADPFGFGDERVAKLRIRNDATWLADFWLIQLDDGSDGDSGADSDGGSSSESPWVGATMPYGSADWLVRFCLSQADRVEVVSPPEIAEEVASRSARALERYA